MNVSNWRCAIIINAPIIIYVEISDYLLISFCLDAVGYGGCLDLPIDKLHIFTRDHRYIGLAADAFRIQFEIREFS